MTNRAFQYLCIGLVLCGLASANSPGQDPAKPAAPDPSAAAKQGLALAAKGQCKEALPLLKKSTARATDKRLKYDAAMALSRCGMSLEQTETAVQALLLLNREFPHDPEVLYTTTHFYSELASRAAQDLAATAPTSAQAGQLEAEAFESKGEFDSAIAQYRKVLVQNPQMRGIHFRLGRIYLTKTPASDDDARKEFEAELKIDPANASAEFMLGEMARQAGQWDEASDRFAKASKLDEGFVEAYLALGMSRNSAGKFADAVAPLENYVKMQPGDPAGHYQLATAYARTGRKQDADREMALQRQASEKTPRN